MTWRNAPNVLKQFRTMLGNCSSWTNAGGASGQVIYPAADEATDTTFPRIVVAHDTSRERIGTSMRLETGTIMGILQGYGRWKDAITAVDADADTVTVSGDISDQIDDGDDFYINGSTDNDGWYIASDVSVSGGNTTITVDTTKGDALTSDTADGSLFTGAIEDLADQIIDDLVGLRDTSTPGLPLRSGERVDFAQFPDSEDTFDYISQEITLETGLETP